MNTAITILDQLLSRHRAGDCIEYADLLKVKEAMEQTGVEPYDHGPQAVTVEDALRDVRKWLNERPNRPLDLRHVAMLCHALKAPQPAQQPVQKPIGYFAFRNGKPSWDDDCVCMNAVYPVDSDDDRVSQAIYTTPPDTEAMLRRALEALENCIGDSLLGGKQRDAAITAIRKHLGEI